MPIVIHRERNAQIIAARQLPPGQRPTLAQLATRFDVSRERIRQIEARERARLRRTADTASAEPPTD